MRKTALFAALLLAACGGGSSSSSGPYEKGRDAAADIKSALERAKAENKRVLIEAGGNWCPWCLKMEKFYAGHASIAKARDKNYVTVLVAVEPSQALPTALASYPAPAGFPHLYVLDADGAVVKSQDTSELEQGETYDVVKFAMFLAANSPKR